MFDVKMLASLMKNPDLPSAAKAMGMDHYTIAPADPTDADACVARLRSLEGEVIKIAELAQFPTTEVIALSGSPGVLKGKRVLILAVLQDAEKKA
jgi:hypothetical protein